MKDADEKPLPGRLMIYSDRSDEPLFLSASNYRTDTYLRDVVQTAVSVTLRTGGNLTDARTLGVLVRSGVPEPVAESILARGKLRALDWAMTYFPATV